MAGIPITPRAGVLSQQVGDEFVLVTPGDNRAHALAGDAAALWRLCDGARDADQIAAELGLPTERVAALLSDLGALGVLEPSTATESIDRRSLLGRGALLGGAAVAVPAILSIAVPAAQAAGSTVSSAFVLTDDGGYDDVNEDTTVEPGQTLYITTGDGVTYEEGYFSPPVVAFSYSSDSEVVSLTYTQDAGGTEAYYETNGGTLTLLTPGQTVTLGQPANFGLAFS